MRRCPRISASSRMPPRLMRVNLRPSARAMLCAERGLSDARGADEAEDRAHCLARSCRLPTCSRWIPRSLKSLRTARNSMILSFTSCRS